MYMFKTTTPKQHIQGGPQNNKTYY